MLTVKLLGWLTEGVAGPQNIVIPFSLFLTAQTSKSLHQAESKQIDHVTG